MAKGSLFVGNGRGKVGNIVLSSLHGAQIARAKSSSRNGSRSSAQGEQRAKYRNANKFYQHAVSNFFTFAFQDIKKNETVQNAFLRHNIKRSVAVCDAKYNDACFPAVGQSWQVSQGSLSVPILCEFKGTVPSFAIGPSKFKDGDAQTVGALSRYLIQNGCERNDIFTLVYIRWSQSGVSAPQWSIMQFVIEPLNSALLSSVATKGTLTAADGFYLQGDATTGQYSLNLPDGAMGVSYGEDENAGGDFEDETENAKTKYIAGEGIEDAAWATVIITRMSRGSVKATSSFLTGNDVAVRLIDTAKGAGVNVVDDVVIGTQSETGNVASTNSTSTNVILGGSVSDGVEPGSRAGSGGSDGACVVVAVDNIIKLPIKYKMPESLYVSNEVTITGEHLDKAKITTENCAVSYYNTNLLNTEAELHFNVIDVTQPFSISFDGKKIIWGRPSIVMHSIGGVSWRSWPNRRTFVPKSGSTQLVYYLQGTNLEFGSINDFGTTNRAMARPWVYGSNAGTPKQYYVNYYMGTSTDLIGQSAELSWCGHVFEIVTFVKE